MRNQRDFADTGKIFQELLQFSKEWLEKEERRLYREALEKLALEVK